MLAEQQTIDESPGDCSALAFRQYASREAPPNLRKEVECIAVVLWLRLLSSLSAISSDRQSEVREREDTLCRNRWLADTSISPPPPLQHFAHGHGYGHCALFSLRRATLHWKTSWTWRTLSRTSSPSWATAPPTKTTCKRSSTLSADMEAMLSSGKALVCCTSN